MSCRLHLRKRFTSAKMHRWRRCVRSARRTPSMVRKGSCAEIRISRIAVRISLSPGHGPVTVRHGAQQVAFAQRLGVDAQGLGHLDVIEA